MSTAATPKAENPATIPALQQMLKLSVAEQTEALQVHMVSVQAMRTAAAVQAPEIAGEEFFQHMQAMQQHYVAAPGALVAARRYILPANLRLDFTTAKPTVNAHPTVNLSQILEGARAVDAALQQVHAETLAMVKSHADELASEAAQAQKLKMDNAQFVQRMNALRERNKQNARAQLDKLYNRLSEVGKVHAEQRARILQTANHGGSFFAVLAADMQQVTHRVEGAVSSAVQTVGSWASGAVKSVGKFFSGLF